MKRKTVKRKQMILRLSHNLDEPIRVTDSNKESSREIGAIPLLTQEQELELGKILKEADPDSEEYKQAKDLMVSCNLRLDGFCGKKIYKKWRIILSGFDSGRKSWFNTCGGKI